MRQNFCNETETSFITGNGLFVVFVIYMPVSFKNMYTHFLPL